MVYLGLPTSLRATITARYCFVKMLVARSPVCGVQATLRSHDPASGPRMHHVLRRLQALLQ